LTAECGIEPDECVEFAPEVIGPDPAIEVPEHAPVLGAQPDPAAPGAIGMTASGDEALAGRGLSGTIGEGLTGFEHRNPQVTPGSEAYQRMLDRERRR
jgi:hypothetical protein